MFIRPHTLSLITTHACTAACDHCCFNCTPKIKDAIPVERIHDLIDEVRDVPSIKVIVFSGGECFLLGDDLFDLIAHAKRNGFLTRCITNGYWATEKNTSKIVASLVDAGLDEINFSTGEEHSQYVPAERVLLGSKTCNEAGIRTLVNVELFNESNFDCAPLIAEATSKSNPPEKAIRLQRNIWIKGDGNRDLNHQPEHSRFNADRLGGCHTAMSVIAVTPNMSLVACCGLHMERIPDLHLGSVKDRTIPQVLNEAPDDFLKIWIHVEGPERILNFVKGKIPEYSLPLESSHPCTTCLHLYSDKTALEVVKAHYREVEQRVSNTFIAGLARQDLDRTLSNYAYGDS